MKKIITQIFCAVFCLGICLYTISATLYAHATAVPNSIYLTFDDGPTDSCTPAVLDILKKESVPATFFVVGSQIPSRVTILQRIADEGHAIGIHTYTHRYDRIYQSPQALKKDILACRDAIKKVLPEYNLTLYRFPGGSSHVSEALREVPAQCGLRYYDWNAATGDAYYRNASAATLYKNAVTTGKDRSRIVLLMHDGVHYNNTIKALPKIIHYYKSKHYVFLPLTQAA